METSKIKIISKKILVSLAAFLVALFSFSSVSYAAISVPEASTSYYSYDYTNGTFYLSSYSGQMGTVNDSRYLYDLPIHGYFNDAQGDKYLNGFFNIHVDFDYTFDGSSSSQDVIFTYDWESDDNLNVIFASPTIDTTNNKISYTIYVFFTNYFIEGRRADLFNLNLHFGFTSTSNLIMDLSPNITSFTDSVTRSTEAQGGDGLAGEVAAAINASSDVDTIITLLSYFTNYNGENFISDVLDHVENLDQVLGNVYTRLGSLLNELEDVNTELDSQTTALGTTNSTLSMCMSALNSIYSVLGNIYSDTTDILDMFTNTDSSNHLYQVRTILNHADTLIFRLLTALTGSTLSSSQAVVANFRSNLQGIIEAALNNVQGSHSGSDTSASAAQSKLQANTQIETSVFDANTQAIGNLDFNVVTTFGSTISGIKNASLFAGNQVTWLYNNSPAGFRFIIQACLISGLMVLVIGAIRHFVK